MEASLQTLGELAVDKAQALCDEFDIDASTRAALRDGIELLGEGWFGEPLRDAPPWQNDLTDDGTPFELSAAFLPGGTEVRALAEPQKAPYGTRSNWLAGMDVHTKLRANGFDLTRFDSIAWLFEPAPGSSARFAMWHALAVNAGARPNYKVYLNPQVRGAEHSAEITRRALQLLGLESAWEFIERQLEQEPGSELLYFSLDLDASTSARVKIYVAHPRARVEALEQAMQDTRGYVAGSCAEWLHSLTQKSGPFDSRSILVCYAFDGLHAEPRATLHVPVRSYSANDAEVVERMTPWLTEEQAEHLASALPRISGRPLEVGRGLITYVSFQYREHELRVTAYLAPQAYAIAAPRPTRAPTAYPARSTMRALRPTPSSSTPLTMFAMHETIQKEAQRLRTHPFLRTVAIAEREQLRVMAESLTFWVLCFQDVLRLGAKLVKDPALVGIAHTHAEEDHGHEQWFLSDVEKLGAARELRWVFSGEHVEVRDISYRLISEVLSARDDRARVAVLLSLDAIGAEFFGLAVQRLDQLDMSHGLQYFARSHQEIEASHDIFEADSHQRLMGIELPPELADDVLGAVARTFDALRSLADYLDARMAAASQVFAVAE